MAGKFSVTRYHDISCGHRVVGHESKCRHLHGHNYRFFFTIEPVPLSTPRAPNGLDDVGRVLDFSVIKTQLCEWLEKNWDHKFLMWTNDPILEVMDRFVVRAFSGAGITEVPFNPTAENMARHLVEVIGPKVLPKDVRLVRCTVEETRKCSATYEVK